MANRVAYLGPQGTFTEEAALLYDGQAELVPYPSIGAVAQAVIQGATDQGVVPIENSIEGSVTETLDLLIHEPKIRIRGEIVLPVRLFLLAKPGTRIEQVETVFSHPQALGQSRRFLRRYLPQVKEVAALSTAAAVQAMMADTHHAAAIGTRRAAKLFNAKIIARRIQDYPVNLTRFVALAQADHPPTNYDRTSLCFYIAEDRPGALVNVLLEFSQRSINLSKIESRPSKESLGKYFFLVDLEGHRQDPLVKEALEQIQRKVAQFKIFGSYPRWRQED